MKITLDAKIILDSQGPLAVLGTKDGKPMPENLDADAVLRGEGPEHVVVLWRRD